MSFNVIEGWNNQDLEQITNFYKKNTNNTLNTSYTDENFKLSNLFKVFYSAILKDKEINNSIVDILNTVNQSITELSESTFQSQAGLESGIKESLILLDSVNAISVANNNTNDDFRGVINIAIRYNNDLEDDENTNQEIANTIAQNIGAGIHTFLSTQTPDKTMNGVLQGSNRPILVGWFKAIDTPIFIRLNYKKQVGEMLPPGEEIKADLLKVLNANYTFGGVFSPYVFANICNFSYFREVSLEYSKDGAEWSGEETTPDFKEYWLFSADRITLINKEGS